MLFKITNGLQSSEFKLTLLGIIVAVLVYFKTDVVSNPQVQTLMGDLIALIASYTLSRGIAKAGKDQTTTLSTDSQTPANVG